MSRNIHFLLLNSSIQELTSLSAPAQKRTATMHTTQMGRNFPGDTHFLEQSSIWISLCVENKRKLANTKNETTQ